MAPPRRLRKRDSETSDIELATQQAFGKRLSEIDRRLRTYRLLLEQGFRMLPSEPKTRLPVYLLSAKSFRLLSALRQLLPLGSYEACWILMRSAFESNVVGAHVSFYEDDALKWLRGKRISMKEIRSKGKVSTWKEFWSSMHDKVHPDITGLPISPIEIEGRSDPLAFVITDPPEIAPAFDRDNCESLLFALDLETCKGATLHVRIFKNSILDTSTKLSDRFAELFKHATRLLGRPEYAKPIQLTEKKFGLDMFYRKTSSSED